MGKTEPILTRAERTGYEETSLHADVLAFIDALREQTSLVRRIDFGKSAEGRDMAAILVSDTGVETASEARKQGKLVLMVEANIHAGEVEGKESVLALARDLTIGSQRKQGKAILSHVALVLVPNVNPDGNDRISPENRRLNIASLEGQVNPRGGVGTRYTGEGWNMNRDAMKQEAIETRNMARLFHAAWPHMFVDCHTTDGSLHAFDLTFDTSHTNQRFFRDLQRETWEMLGAVGRRIEKEHGYLSHPYGNFVEEARPAAGWQTYPALPRFGSHFRGLLGRIDVLLETYSYIDFKRRCRVMYAWLLGLLRYAAENAKRLIRAVEDAEARIVRAGKTFDPRPRIGIDYGVAARDAEGKLVFDYPAHAAKDDVAQIVSFDRESLATRKYPGKQVEVYRVPHLRTFEPTQRVSVPKAYLVPAHMADRLDGHHLPYEALERDTELDVEGYRVHAIEKTSSPDVAAPPSPPRFETVVTVRPERRRAVFPKGTLVVPTARRTGILAVYLLEPGSDDGLTRWEAFDDALTVGDFHPVHRMLHGEEAERA